MTSGAETAPAGPPAHADPAPGGIKGDVIDIGVLRTTPMECGEWIQGDIYTGRVVRVANSFMFEEPVFNVSGVLPFYRTRSRSRPSMVLTTAGRARSWRGWPTT